MNTYFAFDPTHSPKLVKLKAADFDEAEIAANDLSLDTLWVFDTDDLIKLKAELDKIFSDLA